MPNRAVENAHLLQARGHLVGAAARLCDQSDRIAMRRSQGSDSHGAEASLRIIRESLRLIQAHKELVEEMLTWRSVDVTRYLRTSDLPSSSYAGMASPCEVYRRLAAEFFAQADSVDDLLVKEATHRLALAYQRLGDAVEEANHSA